MRYINMNVFMTLSSVMRVRMSWWYTRWVGVRTEMRSSVLKRPRSACCVGKIRNFRVRAIIVASKVTRRVSAARRKKMLRQEPQTRDVSDPLVGEMGNWGGGAGRDRQNCDTNPKLGDKVDQQGKGASLLTNAQRQVGQCRKEGACVCCGSKDHWANACQKNKGKGKGKGGDGKGGSRGGDQNRNRRHCQVKEEEPAQGNADPNPFPDAIPEPSGGSP